MKNVFKLLLPVVFYVLINPLLIFSDPVTTGPKEILKAAEKGDTDVFVELIKEKTDLMELYECLQFYLQLPDSLLQVSAAKN